MTLQINVDLISRETEDLSDFFTSPSQHYSLQVIDLRHNDLVLFGIKTDFKNDEIIILLQIHVYFDASLKKRNYLLSVQN